MSSASSRDILSETQQISSQNERQAEAPRERALREAEYNLINDMQDVLLVTSYIYSRYPGKLPTMSREEIKSESMRIKQAMKLYDLVNTLGDEGYDLLREALEDTDQKVLLGILPKFTAPSSKKASTAGEFLRNDQASGDIVNAWKRLERLLEIEAHGVIGFKLDNVSKLDASENYFSGIKNIGGVPWKLRVQVTEEDELKIVWIDLMEHKYDYQRVNTREMADRFIVSRTITLHRLDFQTRYSNFIDRSCGLHRRRCYRPSSILLPYDWLVKPGNEWLLNDSMLITCEIEVEKVEVGRDASSYINLQLSGIEKMPVGQRNRSSPENFFGVRWRIIAEVTSNKGQKYLGLFLQPDEEDLTGRQFQVSHQMEIVQQSYSLEALKNGISCMLGPVVTPLAIRWYGHEWRENVYPDPGTGETCQGNAKFINFNRLNDPEQCYVAKDTVHIRCHLNVKELNRHLSS